VSLIIHPSLTSTPTRFDVSVYTEAQKTQPNVFLSFIGQYNWKLAFFVEVVIRLVPMSSSMPRLSFLQKDPFPSLVFPSLFSFIMLFIACLATIIPGDTMTKWLPGVVFYSFVCVVPQYIFNLPHLFDFTNNEAIVEVGLGTITPFLLYFGLKGLAMFFYCSYWRYR